MCNRYFRPGFRHYNGFAYMGGSYPCVIGTHSMCNRYRWVRCVIGTIPHLVRLRMLVRFLRQVVCRYLYDKYFGCGALWITSRDLHSLAIESPQAGTLNTPLRGGCAPPSSLRSRSRPPGERLRPSPGFAGSPFGKKQSAVRGKFGGMAHELGCEARLRLDVVPITHFAATRNPIAVVIGWL